MSEPSEASEAARVYQHFREIFGGGPGTRPGRASRFRTREPSGSQPFAPGRDPKPLADSIDALSHQLGWSGPLSQHEVLASWAEIAGEETARHTEPIAIEGGVLQVRCESTAWATQLRMMRTQLVTEIALRFPGAEVETIRFQGPDAPTWKRGPRSVPGRGPRDTYG
jgi:predicted nucleic acid-binding Zn ribbon protein